jgi:hypothetical protein
LGNAGFNWSATASGTGGDTGNYEGQVVQRSLNDVAALADDSVNFHTPRNISANSVLFGTIEKDGKLVRGAADVDLFRFQPSSTGQYVIQAQGVGEFGADTFLRVFSSSGTQLALNDDAGPGTLNSEVSISLTAGQTYYFGVNGYSPQAQNYDALTGGGAAPGSIGDYSLSVSSARIVGDYNRNGAVDAADYVVWRKTLGNSVPPFSGADGGGDGTVDPGDYGLWRNNFGRTAASAAGAATPFFSQKPHWFSSADSPAVGSSLDLSTHLEAAAGDSTFASAAPFFSTAASSPRGNHSLASPQSGHASPQNKQSLLLLEVTAAAFSTAAFDAHPFDPLVEELLGDEISDEHGAIESVFDELADMII